MIKLLLKQMMKMKKCSSFKLKQILQQYSKKITTEQRIKCYYCDFLPKSKKLRDIEDEMMTHVEDTHKVAREDLDTENFDDEYHQDFLGLFTDE
jgi:hypothetical protein